MTGGFYHCSVKNVGRSNGRSIVAAAAYRSGERLADERTGETADYRARGGVVDTFILARDGAPAWAYDRARLWNEAERAEARANGRLATEFELALPHELTDAQRKQLLKDYLAPILEKHGIAVDVAIHAPGEGKDHRNIHAHVLLTHRQLDAHGFGDIANTRTMTRKRKGREVQEQVAGIAATPADIKAIRKDWEQHVNRAYERAGLDIRVDHRSHEERGIAQEPTKHLGPTVAEMEKDKPGSSDRAAVNREITQRNATRILAAMREAEVSQIKAELVDAKAELAMQAAHAGARGRYDSLRETERDVQRDQFNGRYDDLRAAEPPPEVVREFDSNANRTAEPAAPIYDRDADNAAWEAKLADAAIEAEAQKARQQPDASAARETRAGAGEPSSGPENSPEAELWDELSAWSTDARPARADEIEVPRDTHDADIPADHTAHDIFDGIEEALHAGTRAASGAASRLAKAVENVLGGIFSLFGAAEPKLTPMQAELAARANDELAEARAAAAASREKEAAQDWMIFQQDRQQQQDELDIETGRRERPGDRERERERDWP